MRWMTAAVWMVVGCGTGPAEVECGPAECAPICEGLAEAAPPPPPAPEPTGVVLADHEAELLAPLLEDVRAGVRPFDDQGVGICRGSRECEVFLGQDAGELPPGTFMLQAELRVPRHGEDWSIEVATECETVRVTDTDESRTTSSSSRSYDVRYAGEQRGYRLRPLRTITSPSPGGAQHCTWTLTAPHPGGDQVLTGSWSVPAAD